MRDQLQLLAELQQLDIRLQELSDERDQLPAQLKPYELTCERAHEAFAEAKDEIEQAERQRRTLERELDADQERLVKTQNRLHGIKTNKEYSAVLAEIETGKQRISSIEDQVLELMEAAEHNRQASQTRERDVQIASRELEAQGKKVAESQQALTQQLEAQGAERQELASRLDPALHQAYERATARAGRTAAVPLTDGACGGCFLTVRPQLVSEVRRQEEVVTCPHCQRILLWPA